MHQRRTISERAGILGIGAAACVACCAGPILAFVGGIVALGAVGTFLMGATAVALALIAVATVLLARRTRPRSCTTGAADPVAVESPRRKLRQS